MYCDSYNYVNIMWLVMFKGEIVLLFCFGEIRGVV